jgi:hypothetical protein
MEKAERENGIIEVGAKEEEEEGVRKIMRMRMRIKWRNGKDTEANYEEVKGVRVFKPCADDNYTKLCLKFNSYRAVNTPLPLLKPISLSYGGK